MLRSDYMLHEPDGGAEPPRLLQVELNTIAASFASLSNRVSALHAYLAARWPAVRRQLWDDAGRPSRLLRAVGVAFQRRPLVSAFG